MHPVSTTTYSTACHNQKICLISRLIYVSFIVILSFTVCMIHEFAFIINYRTSSTSSNDIRLKQTKIFWNQNLYADDWRKVTDNIYVYSAYWDTRLPNESFVRIIGGAKYPGSDLNLTKCFLKVNDSSTIVEVPVRYEILIEHHNKPSKAIYVKCLLSNYDLPTFVTIVPIKYNDSWATEATWITVQKLQSEVSPINVGVCVRPIFNFTDVFRISEFIAYYEALGATRFTFYDYNASEDVIKYLYELKKGSYSINILPWSLPSALNDMWAVGQMANINDCIYRNMRETKYMAIVDLDEFITPRRVMTLHELMKIQDIPSKRVASFVIRSSVFCAEYQEDVLPPAILPFKTQIDIRRENFIYPFLIRSKYIVKPYFVEVSGVHHVWRIMPGWEERFIPASQALVHHYRGELCISNNKTLQIGEIDVKSRKYLNALMRSKAVSTWKKNFF